MLNSKMVGIAIWLSEQSVHGTWSCTSGGELQFEPNGQLNEVQNRWMKNKGFVHVVHTYPNTIVFDFYVYRPKPTRKSRAKVDR